MRQYRIYQDGIPGKQLVFPTLDEKVRHLVGMVEEQPMIAVDELVRIPPERTARYLAKALNPESATTIESIFLVYGASAATVRPLVGVLEDDNRARYAERILRLLGRRVADYLDPLTKNTPGRVFLAKLIRDIDGPKSPLLASSVPNLGKRKRRQHIHPKESRRVPYKREFPGRLSHYDYDDYNRDF